VTALSGCPDDEDSVTLASIDAVGASGMFSRQEGVLLVSVSPRDADGNFVGQDLPDSAFSFEDVVMHPQGFPTMIIDVETSVSGVSTSEPDPDASLSGVVIFDSSGSMSDNDPGATGRRSGGEALFDILRAGDELAVLDFGAGATSPFFSTRVIQDFTSERTLLSASLDQLTEQGGTPLFESIREGLTLLDPATTKHDGEPALVVLTDGQASDAQLVESAIADAQRMTVPVFAIGLGQSLDYSDLTRLTSETGGAFVEASDAMALERAFAGISSGVRLGSVTVQGNGSYTLPSNYTRYTVSGTLVTESGGERFETPFTFTVDIE
jgi:uncharacterized protein YegL